MNLQLQFSMPVRVISEANARDHHMVRYKRKLAQQNTTAVAWLWACAAQRVNVSLPCVVRLTRIGARKLDDDNLAGAFKACRDQIAREIGVDDGSELIKFEYAQEAIGKRQYEVKVEVYQK
jgi:hypothetical protein